MTKTLCVVASNRNEFGSRAVRRNFREQSRIPAVLYGANQDVVSLWLDHNSIEQAVKISAFHSGIFKLEIEGTGEKVVLKDYSRHPVRQHVTHIDFLRVRADEKLTMKIPVHLVGEEALVNVKKEGGVLSHLLTEIEVECLPENLPESISVDVSSLTIGDTVHLSMAVLPKGVEHASLVDGDHDLPIVSMQRVVEEPVEEEMVESEEGEGEGDDSGDEQADASSEEETS